MTSDWRDRLRIEVELDGSSVIVRCPFHPAFVARAKENRGRYDGREWSFSREKEGGVRQAVKDVFGTDGADTARLVTVDIQIGKLRLAGRTDLFMAGRCVASRPARDATVRLGAGVTILHGGFPVSGGTEQNPRLEPYQETVVRLSEVPEPAALNARREHPSLVSISQTESAAAPGTRLEQLQRERVSVQEQLAQLDAEIERLSHPPKLSDQY